MTDKNSITRRRLMFAKNSILMLVMLVVIFMAAFAWYHVNRNAYSEGITLSADRVGTVQIAFPEYEGLTEVLPEDSSFSSTVNLSDIFKDEGIFQKLIKDVTSDGTHFAIPTFDSSVTVRDGRTVVADGDWTDGLSSEQALYDSDPTNDSQYNYLSRSFYLRSTKPDVFLSEKSYLAAESELQNKTIASGFVNPSQKAPFSADAIVGAVRVSLSVENLAYEDSAVSCGSPSTSLVWLPRPDIYVTTADREEDWKLGHDEDEDGVYTYVKPTDSLAATTYRHTYYEGQLVSGTIQRGVVEKTFNDSGVFPNSPFTAGAGLTECSYFKVTKIPSSDYEHLGTDGFYPTFGQNALVADGGTLLTSAQTSYEEDWYMYRVTLNLWIEGADAEARREMNGGKFQLFMDFINN